MTPCTGGSGVFQQFPPSAVFTASVRLRLCVFLFVTVHVCVSVCDSVCVCL